MNADEIGDIHHALGVIAGSNQVVELRILNTGRTGTVSGYFTDIKALATVASQWSGKAPSVYITLNPVKTALLAWANNRAITHAKTTTADRDIENCRWFPLDFDPVRPAGMGFGIVFDWFRRIIKAFIIWAALRDFLSYDLATKIVSRYFRDA